MFRKLVSRNADLARLVERGYAVAFDSNCLVVRDIPYLDRQGALQSGAIVAKLVFIDQEHVQQDDHQIYFAGGHPHQLDGSPIRNLGGGETRIRLSSVCADVVVQRSFSNKPMPQGSFLDFYAKIESYVSIISGPAIERHPTATPLTYRVVEAFEPDPIFKLQDTLTSRAQIGDLNTEFAGETVAIIGLGGTGAYLLDLLVKTPVPNIRAFDGDTYHVHTAFRSPGRFATGELRTAKATVYGARYDNFRHGLTVEATYIDQDTAERLDGVTFAFVCVDKGSSRAGIFDALISRNIPFIDVGMGLNRKHGTIGGMLRATYYPRDEGATMRDRKLADLSDAADDIYRSNIQIGELNALNACLAVIRYKQIRGFYRDTEGYRHVLFGIDDLSLTGDTYDKD
ncbi:ThiF family adenylyltransferase [Rhizobium sp. BR 314]|uniref:ThiF family adenylyltransferase n=1 Tax=Rhizobium sp. BR 314 TaxID=3040013 RepID=UPI0039BF375F